MLSFPENFLWGAATSAYQVEGNNKNCDWWKWEKSAGLEASGHACRHYEFFRNDFDLAKKLNHNAHRLSIEWSRVEPRQGQFSREEINHYKEVIHALRERGIEPIVTLHHFTNPLWFAAAGGWLNDNASERFSRYVEKIVKELCKVVDFWITVNEPLVYTYHSYCSGKWPPRSKSFLLSRTAKNNMARAHVKAYRIIHDIYKEKGIPKPLVSIAKHFRTFTPRARNPVNTLSVYLREKLFNFGFIEHLIRRNSLDYIGVNYYTRDLVDVRRPGLKALLLNTCDDSQRPLKKNYMGWNIYPQGLYEVLMKLKKYSLPILITENGICTENDRERWDFIREHLKSAHRAIEHGAKILGYLYWSFMDNYEWDSGFGPRFGLIEIDYNTGRRLPRESAEKFALVCASGKLG